MSAAGEHVESDRCRTGVRRQTFCIPAWRQRDCVVDFCIRSFREKNSARWWSNAFAVAALRRRARATETRTSRSRATMAPTLRPRTPRKGGETQAARPPRATRPDRGEAPRATRNRATARRHEASRCPAAGGCSCITSGSSRRSRSGGTTSACRSLTSRGAVVAHPTSSSRVARRCRLNARVLPRPTRAADLFERLARPDLRTRARRTAAETTSSGDPNTERDAPCAARARDSPLSLPPSLPRLTSSLPHRSAKVYGTSGGALTGCLLFLDDLPGPALRSTCSSASPRRGRLGAASSCCASTAAARSSSSARGTRTRSCEGRFGFTYHAHLPVDKNLRVNQPPTRPTGRALLCSACLVPLAGLPMWLPGYGLCFDGGVSDFQLLQRAGAQRHLLQAALPQDEPDQIWRGVSVLPRRAPTSRPSKFVPIWWALLSPPRVRLGVRLRARTESSRTPCGQAGGEHGVTLAKGGRGGP